MTSFQSSELTELPVVENGQLFAQRAHSARYAPKGGQNQKSKPPLGVTMMPLGAPSISKYGSLVRPDAQIVALRLRLPLYKGLDIRYHTLGCAMRMTPKRGGDMAPAPTLDLTTLFEVIL